jgi:hypothetical protein
LTLTTAPAHAAPRPQVTWTLPAGDAGKPTAFSWKVKHPGAGAKLVVQRRQGTARVWRTVSNLHGTSGTSRIGALALGRYSVRLAVLRRGQVGASSAKQLLVYGTVPFSSLLFGTKGFGQGTLASPTGTFDYVLTHLPRFAPNNGINSTTIAAGQNRCRSAHVDFVLGDSGLPTDSENAQATLSVVQATADPVTATTPYATIGSVDTTLSPGRSWGIVTSQIAGDRAHHLYINGSASCWSADSATDNG